MWKLLTRLTALSACLVSALFSRGRRHPAEQSQRRSLAGVAASSELLGAVSDTVLVVGRDGTVVDRNETVETRLPSVELGMPLTEALPELAGTDCTEPTRIKRHHAGETRRYRVETAPVTLLGWLPVGQAVVITDAQRESKGDDRDRQSVVLEQIQRNISDVVWMSDVGDAPMGKQSMEFITDSYADIWERSPESLHEDPTQFVDAIHPEDRERVEAALAEQADNPDEYEETYRIRTPDGETKWIHDRSSGVYVDGELQRVIGVATEITARKQREREAKREREFFEQAINALSDVFYVLDTDGTFRRWNQELAAVCGVEEETLAGRDATSLFIPKDRQLVREAIDRVVTDGQQTVEARLSTNDGPVPYEFTGSPLYDEAGSLVGVVGIGRDLSERYRREQTLETFRQAVEHAGSMIYWLDEDGTVEYVNPAFESQTGYDASALIGEIDAPLASRAVAEGTAAEMFDTLRDGETWETKFMTRNAAGERRRVRQTVTPVTHDGSTVQFVAVAVDVTEEAKRRQQLSVLHRVLRHDLRNDLNEILLSVQLAERNTEQTAVRERLDAIERTVEDTLSLSKNVARFNQLFERDETKRMTVDLESVVREQVEAIRTERPGVELSTELSETVPVESNDLVDRAVRNLLRNAVEHNDMKEPQVTITASNRSDTDEIALHVADNGPGISEETVRVLESDSETQLQHLDGVGLWLVKWVMSMSGGRVEFDRREPRGTVVTLVFPIASAQQ